MAGQRAIEAHYARVGIDAEVFPGEYPGLYRTRYRLKEKPMVSILIPNKDHTEDLKRCIDSIEEKSAYKNYEYIIIENNSTEEKNISVLQEAGGTESQSERLFIIKEPSIILQLIILVKNMQEESCYGF